MRITLTLLYLAMEQLLLDFLRVLLAICVVIDYPIRIHTACVIILDQAIS